MAEKDDNLADLRRQAQASAIAAPTIPSLAVLTRGFCRPELQHAFEVYDQQMKEWHLKSQVAGSTAVT